MEDFLAVFLDVCFAGLGLLGTREVEVVLSLPPGGQRLKRSFERWIPVEANLELFVYEAKVARRFRAPVSSGDSSCRRIGRRCTKFNRVDTSRDDRCPSLCNRPRADRTSASKCAGACSSLPRICRRIASVVGASKSKSTIADASRSSASASEFKFVFRFRHGVLDGL